LVAASRDKSSLAGYYGQLRNDYSAARASRYRRRRTGLALAGGGADYHYKSEGDFLRLIEYARDFDRNDMVVGQVVDRVVSNTVQGGFTVCPTTGDKAIDLELWNRWQDWSCDPEQCDLAGELSFPQLERLADRAVKVDGDIIGLTLSSGHLQLVEAHRVRTPRGTKRNVVHGVLLDEARRRQEYWITKDDVDPLQPVGRVSEVTPYKVRDDEGFRQVLHLYNPKRISQTRGITAFAPIFDAVGMHDDAEFARLVQQQVLSCFTVFREKLEYWEGADDVAQRGARTTDTYSDGATRRVEGIAPGTEIRGEKGEKLTGFTPDVPGDGFFQHVKLILTFIGINLGAPLVLVLLDASETNFSGWRGAIDQARMGFCDNQRLLVSRLHCPVWRWKVRQWLADDPALAAAAQRGDIKIFGHSWQPPTFPYIEPYKDAAADLVRVRNGLISPRRLHAEHGRDWETIAEETVADNAYAIRQAKTEAVAINGAFRDEQPVHWRELLSLPTPDGVSISLPAVEQPQQKEVARAAA
jgi:lambda family phage portal protein